MNGFTIRKQHESSTMSELSDKDLKQFEQRFVARRDELRRIIHDELLATQREEFVELAGQVHDSGDESIAELLIGIDLAGRQRELEEMQDVEAALERIAAGSFGECMDCGDDINRSRLDAYPTAKRCLRCQTRYETAQRGGRDATPSL